jgi:dCMP deaminase
LLTEKEQVFLKIANELGQLSTCPRKAVGAVIVRDGRCISWGYNGAPPGLPHCTENECGKLNPPYPPVYGCRNATHAEENALAFAARQGISTDGGTLFVSTSPCDVCARLLIAAGIAHVIAQEAYRDLAPIELLRDGGVGVLVYDSSTTKVSGADS